jgi:YVTN family beta-propeller protein
VSEGMVAIGAELGGYRLEAPIGRGGMSAVYRAEDLRLGRRVALKVLSADVADDDRFRTRFLAESRLAASIDHPGIVSIFEADEADGVLYIAMRLVDGGDLGALLEREGPLEPGRAVAIVSQLAAALDTAHGHGLVHRDVKPSNALISADGGAEHVYLADFGISKHSGSRDGPTGTGQMVGTVAYVAPEQIRGDAVDGRADIYSLGCVLFECLTGEPPFAGRSDVATMYAHLEEDPPRAGALRPELPAGLDAVVRRAMAKDPARRFQTGAELADAARAALAGGAPARMARRAPRRPAVLLAACAVAVAAVAALLVARSVSGPSATPIAANAVAVIDPSNPSRTAQVPVGASPSELAAGEGAVWVTNTDDRTVSRIDPATRTVRQTIPVGSGPGAIAAGAGGVWVANSLDGTVSWISPATNGVIRTIPVGNGPSGVCVGGGGVWVANSDDHAVARIDPASGRRTATVRLDDAPGALACGGGAVWASSESAGIVTQISTASRSVVGTTSVGAGAGALAFGAGGVWVANPRNGTVSQVDPQRGVVVRTVAGGAGDGPVDVAAGAGAVWVSNEFAGTIDRIDPRRGVVVSTLKVGNRPQGLALVGGSLWAGVRAGAAAHRGGTLRVLFGTDVRFRRTDVDPAAVAAYGSFAQKLLGITNDGLTTFRRTGGIEGGSVVPDLAVALPEPTDSGRTYVFRLRRGVRYSNGAPVRAGDIRRGLERVVRADTFAGQQFYASIIGVAACTAHPRECDLSRGIVADDRTGTITFHLTAPDPQFLDELALDFAVAVPPGTGRHPPPATGPYVLEVGRSPGALRLVRNPHFHVWSSAAKPDGYPDVITLETGLKLPAGVTAVERGRADYVTVLSAVDLSRPRLDELFTRYAGQIHTSAQASTVYFWLNTRAPPFDSVDVRRAVNYAIDRRAALAFQGGPRLAAPTCQILPRGFPGYRPYCPYSAPDLARARRLIARSGTRGMRVTVLGRSPGFVSLSRFYARVLDELGYRTSVRIVPEQRILDVATRPGAQTGPLVFTEDFPAASNFLGVTFGCGALLNWSRFCDARTRDLIRQAQSLPASRQGEANALWGGVDREIVDQAAAVPLLNPKAISLVSRRVGNVQYHPLWGDLFDQLWVR